jgi:diguanylate cyclase (GGDEF)-like protein
MLPNHSTSSDNAAAPHQPAATAAPASRASALPQREDGPAKASDAIRRTMRRAPAFFAALLALTVGLLVWQHVGMERVYELSARSGHVVAARSDVDVGGTSRARLGTQDGALRLTCNLEGHTAWPYCKMAFELGHGVDGVDLSHYDAVSLDVDYRGPGAHNLRLAFTDFERGLAVADDYRTHKVAEFDSFTLPANGRITIPLKLVRVASYWKEQQKVDLMRTDVRLDNVISFELQTAPGSPLGQYDIAVRSIRFTGKAIGRADLLFCLVSLWIVSAIGLQASMSWMLKRELATTKAEVALLNELTHALELEAQDLTGQAHHDALTGVLNRQGLRAQLMGSSSLLAPPLSIIFLDLDHFKGINDTHGHKVGDLVLQQFARIVGASVRSTDMLVRWGGEEFLLLCPATNVLEAAAAAEKLRQLVEDGAWPHGIRVTSSFGVAERFPDEDIADVIARADGELYSAKQSGRNRVHTYGVTK